MGRAFPTRDAAKSPGQGRGFDPPFDVRSIPPRGAVATTEAAETVIEAYSEHIHVLADPVVEEGRSGASESVEGVIRVPHEQMVIFYTDGPVRREAIFPAHTDGSAPARRICGDKIYPGDVIEYIKLIAGYSRAALDVEQ